MMLRIRLTLVCSLVIVINAFCQPYCTGTEIESWSLSKNLVPSTFNRASVYIHLINPAQFREMLQGINYTKDERKQLSIKKGDRADYLYLGVTINDSRIAQTEIEIPLLIYDDRDASEASRTSFNSYNGKYLSEIKDTYLDKSIFGKVRIKTLYSNSGKKFMSDALGLVSGIAGSAAQLALTGNPIDLSKEVANIVNQGVSALSNIGDGSRSTDDSFFVTLVSHNLTSNYKEIIIGARLYQVHWDSESINPSKNFKMDQNELNPKLVPKSFEDSISDTKKPYILIVETRSELKFDLKNPSFNEGYNFQISRVYKETRGYRRDVIGNYAQAYQLAYELQTNLKKLDAVLKKGENDNSLIARIIDGYYTFVRDTKSTEVFFSKKKESITQSDYDYYWNNFSDAYKGLADLLNAEVNNISTSRYVSSTKTLVNLLFNLPQKDIDNLSPTQLYNDIEVLDFYRNLINKLKANNISTEKFTLNASYETTKVWLEKLESKLKESLEEQLNELDNGSKINYLENAFTKYSACVECIEFANNYIDIIKNQDYEDAKRNFQTVQDKELSEYDICKDSVYQMYVNNDPSLSIEGLKVTELKKQTYRDAYIELQSSLLEYESVLYRSINAETTINELALWTSNIAKYRITMFENAKYLVDANIYLKPEVCINKF